MSKLVMEINGNKRNVDYNPLEELVKTGSATVCVNPGIKDRYACERLDVDKLTETMKRKYIEHSGKVEYSSFGYSIGFNDPELIGWKEAFDAKRKGLSNIWLSVTKSVDMAQIQVHGDKFRTEFSESDNTEYINEILSYFVKFLEDPANYKTR